MTEQPGPRDPAERRPTDGSGKGVDVFGELQRWFIRQSAKNMRREISGQVRRTFGGGRETSDVWDTATHEIPPEVGESPECQWCPICRAARRMRDSGPGIGDQLSGAGDVVSSAVQDAISALDSLLSKAGGITPTRENKSGDGAAGDRQARTAGSRDSAPRDRPPADSSDIVDGSDGSDGSEGSADQAAPSWPDGNVQDGGSVLDREQGTPSAPERDPAAPDSRRDRHGLVGLPGGGGDSAAARTQDPWGAATEPVEAGQDSDADAQSDGSGNGPDDRG